MDYLFIYYAFHRVIDGLQCLHIYIYIYIYIYNKIFQENLTQKQKGDILHGISGCWSLSSKKNLDKPPLHSNFHLNGRKKISLLKSANNTQAHKPFHNNINRLVPQSCQGLRTQLDQAFHY